jgi:hypothetical protein
MDTTLENPSNDAINDALTVYILIAIRLTKNRFDALMNNWMAVGCHKINKV